MFLRSLFGHGKQISGPSQGGKPKLKVSSSYLSESKFDSSLFEGLGKLLKFLKVTGLLQAGSINSLWRWLALWKCLNWGCCYCACWGGWLLEKEQKNKNKHTPQYLRLYLEWLQVNNLRKRLYSRTTKTMCHCRRYNIVPSEKSRVWCYIHYNYS